ncbi:MAG: hypothetical protein IPG45_04450 [Deltaproteobacteria bacterium]|nr:hypothetical protein [Deltaproteobacteria bacterium]
MRSAWLWLLLFLGVPRPAQAVFQLASDGAVGARALQIAVAEDPEGTRWMVSAQLEGSAKTVALLYLLPGTLTDAQLDEPSALAALEERSAPTLQIFEAADPCADQPPVERRQRLVEPPASAPGAFQLERQRPKSTAELIGRLAQAQLVLSPEAAERAFQHGAKGGALVLLTGPLGGKTAGAWTPVVTFRFNAKALELPLGVAASATMVGRTLRVTLYTAALGSASLVPLGQKVVDLPSGFNLPELAFAERNELVRRLGDQSMRRERSPVILRIATNKEAGPPGAVGRYELQVGRRAEALRLTLAPDPKVLAFLPEWAVHQFWRGPMSCPVADRYRVGATLQLQAELRTYATLTGRPLAEVLKESGRQGYGPLQ